MDQKKCINDVINKYSDFPRIQADMRKLLRYTESAFRFFINDVLNDSPGDNTSSTLNKEIPMILTPELKATSYNLIEQTIMAGNTQEPSIDGDTWTATLQAAMLGKTATEQRYLLDGCRIAIDKMQELKAAGDHIVC